MKYISALGRGYNAVVDFSFMWLYPWAGFFLLLLVTTPIGQAIGVEPPTNVLISLLVFFVVTVGSRLLEKNHLSSRDGSLSFVHQENAIRTSLEKVPVKGTDVRILIYTSFSIFKEFEQSVKTYSGLSNSKLKVLLRDPDLPLLVPSGQYSAIRRSQINTAIDSIFKHAQNNNNVEIRFYKNEPWVRGILVGESYLLYSTYANRKAVVEDETDIEYSGLRVPWIEVNSKPQHASPESAQDARGFISGFRSLFDLVWENCTKNKNLIIDLDGTMFKDDSLAKHLSVQLPGEYIKKIVPNRDSSKSASVLAYYEQSVKKGLSSMESLLNAVNSVTGNSVSLLDYLKWKDSQLDAKRIKIERDFRLSRALSVASATFNLYVLTNHTTKFTKIALDKLGVADLFDPERIITSDKLGYVKPSPHIKTKLQDQYGIDLRSSIFIGDREYVDLSYVQDVALGCILISSPSVLPEILPKLVYPFEWFENYSRVYKDYKVIPRMK